MGTIARYLIPIDSKLSALEYSEIQKTGGPGSPDS
jgi:hypothetical protein